jgi:hypothetical protein
MEFRVGQIDSDQCHVTGAKEKRQITAVEECGRWMFGKVYKVTAVVLEAEEGLFVSSECNWIQRKAGEVYTFEWLASGETR